MLATDETMRVRVLPGCLVRDPNTHEGLRREGDLVDLPHDMADLLIREQGVEPVE